MADKKAMPPPVPDAGPPPLRALPGALLHCALLTVLTVALAAVTGWSESELALRPLFFALLFSFLRTTGARHPHIHGPAMKLCEAGFLVLTLASATSAVLDALDLSGRDSIKPKILDKKVISRVDGQHAFLINRNKIGSMLLPGESLFVLECQPASYAILATNEAEKAADIKVIDYRMIGATGRVYLSVEEANVRAAGEAAVAALEAIA